MNDIITDSTQRYYLEAIHRSGKTLLQLINDVLDLSKIEAGKLELSYSQVDLKSIFDDMAVIFMQKLSEKSIFFECLFKLEVEFAKNIPPALMLDEIRIRQVLLNLVSNAVKFTHQGFVRAKVTMQPTASAKHLHLIIDVMDSGIGIAPDQLEAVFSIFTQQKHQSSQYGGTGLGLTISKRLVELMGGTIRVSSELGVGSCFTIELPTVEIGGVIEELPEEEKYLTHEKVDFQPATVLLVDDIQANRHLVNAYLQGYTGLTVIEADTGEKALGLVSEQRFDLILMDKILPDLDGEVVCEKIRAMPDCKDIPIIMLTASALSSTNQQSPVFYNTRINKPVSKNELLAAMQLFLPTV